MNSTIRIVVFADGDLYVAQALEVDISAQGRTAEEARVRLGILIRAEAQEAQERGGDLFDIGPAPAAFHVMYEGREISKETMKAA